jgi:uncharacterized protein (DUF2249 family)
MAEPLELDNRGLGPPEPMIRILDALPTLGEGQELIARNDRDPIFLYPELKNRGFEYETSQLEDGSFRIRIWKA